MVREGCDVGFIPTPMKLEALRVKSMLTSNKSSFDGRTDRSPSMATNYYDDGDNDDELRRGFGSF